MRLRRAWWNAMVVAALALPLIACGDDDVPVDAGGRDAMSDAARVDAGPDDDAGEGDAGSDGGVVTEGPVVTTAAPSSVARASALELTGERLADATGVTIGGVAQTMSANTATSVTIDAVDDTTPTGTQPVVVTTAEGASAPVDVTVLEALAVASAAAPSATTVVVTFSRDVDAASVDAASFTIDGLTVSAASAAGAIVTLTSSAQTPGADYTVEVAATVTDTFGNALTGTSDAAFAGFEPTVPVITSVAPMHVVPGTSELTITGAMLTGATITIGGAAQVITSSTATEIVLGTVSASTPLGTQAVIATVAGTPSAPIDVEVVDAFRIVSATASDATTVAITFNRNVDAASATAARFTITPALAVSAVSVAGAVVTLTTATQAGGETYTVGADAMLLDGFGIGATADAAAFTGFTPPLPTEFVVVRVGDGTIAVTDTPAYAVFLERRSIATGAVVATLPMPVATSGTNLPFTLSGRITDGALTRSQDGSVVALAGYQSVPGTANVQAATTPVTPRVVAVISADDFATPGGVDTSTTIGTAFGGTAPRSAVVDGTNVWVNGGFGGLFTTTIGGSTATQVLAVPAGSPGPHPSAGRTLGIFDGQLYLTTNTAPAGLYQVGTGTPTGTGTVATLLAGTAEPFGFAVFDVDPVEAGPDRIYLADSGLKRFRRVAGVWTHDPATDVFGPAVRFVACMENGPDIVCLGTNTAGTAILRMTDVGASSPGSATAFTSIATAAANTGFRGVAIAPAL